MSCRFDNGRAFRQAAKPRGSNWVIVQFHDFSVYQVSPFDDKWLLDNSGAKDQPACYFNHEQWHDPAYRFKHLRHWPTIPPHWLHVVWAK